MQARVLVDLVIILISLMVFIVGFHDNDNAFNLHTFNSYVDETVVEHNIYGNEVNEYNLHAKSLWMIFVSYMVLLAIALSLLVENSSSKQ